MQRSVHTFCNRQWNEFFLRFVTQLETSFDSGTKTSESSAFFVADYAPKTFLPQHDLHAFYGHCWALFLTPRKTVFQREHTFLKCFMPHFQCNFSAWLRTHACKWKMISSAQKRKGFVMSKVGSGKWAIKKENHRKWVSYIIEFWLTFGPFAHATFNCQLIDPLWP